jgi:hypothetical protein
MYHSPDVRKEDFMKRILILCMPFMLTGCFTVYPGPPPGVPTAQLRVVQTYKEVAATVVEYQEECRPGSTDPYKIASLDGSAPLLYPHLRQSLGMLDPPESLENYTEFKIRADKPVYIAVHRTAEAFATLYFSRYKTCNVYFSFLPQPNAQYEAQNKKIADGCGISLARLEVVNSKVTRHPVKIDDIPLCRKN